MRLNRLNFIDTHLLKRYFVFLINEGSKLNSRYKISGLVFVCFTLIAGCLVNNTDNNENLPNSKGNSSQENYSSVRLSSSFQPLSSSSVSVPIKDTSVVSCSPLEDVTTKDERSRAANIKPASASRSTCPIDLKIETTYWYSVEKCLYQEKTDGVVTDTFEKEVQSGIPNRCFSREYGSFEARCVLNVTYCSSGAQCRGYIGYSESVSELNCD